MTSSVSLQVTYKGGRPLAAYLYLAANGERKAVRTEELAPDLVVDYGADGAPVGVEILSPGTVTVQDIWSVFDRLGLERPAASELSPLSAA